MLDTIHLRELAETHREHVHTARLLMKAADEIDRLRIAAGECPSCADYIGRCPACGRPRPGK